jgi:hypothetical protein
LQAYVESIGNQFSVNTQSFEKKEPVQMFRKRKEDGLN